MIRKMSMLNLTKCMQQNDIDVLIYDQNVCLLQILSGYIGWIFQSNIDCWNQLYISTSAYTSLKITHPAYGSAVTLTFDLLT